MNWPSKGWGFPISGDPGVCNGDESALPGVFGHADFVGKDFQVSDRGYCVHLGAWVHLDSHGLDPIPHEEHHVLPCNHIEYCVIAINTPSDPGLWSQRVFYQKYFCFS